MGLAVLALALTACRSRPGGSTSTARDDAVPASPPGDATGLATDAPPTPAIPDDRAARLAAARAVVPAGTDCVPAPPDGDDSERRLLVTSVGGAPVLCLAEQGRGVTFVGLLACWTVDPDTGALAYRDPAPPAGVGFRIALDRRGCAYGFCPPGPPTPGDLATIAWSTTGKQVALGPGPDNEGGDSLRVHVFDATSHQLVRSLPVAGDGGLTNALAGFVLVGDILLVTGVDAGPYAGVWAFSTTATPLPADDPLYHDNDEPRDPYLDVYAGGVSVLDDHRALVAEAGLATAVVVDTDARTTSRVTRRGLACTAEQLATWQRDGELPRRKSCARQIRDDLAPLAGASLVALPSSTYLAASSYSDELMWIDPSTLAIRRRAPLPACPP